MGQGEIPDAKNWKSCSHLLSGDKRYHCDRYLILLCDSGDLIVNGITSRFITGMGNHSSRWVDLIQLKKEGFGCQTFQRENQPGMSRSEDPGDACVDQSNFSLDLK